MPEVSLQDGIFHVQALRDECSEPCQGIGFSPAELRREIWHRNMVLIHILQGGSFLKFQNAKVFLAQGAQEVDKAKQLVLDYIHFLKPSVSSRAVDLVFAINCLRRCYSLQGRVVYKPRAIEDEVEEEEYLCLSIKTG